MVTGREFRVPLQQWVVRYAKAKGLGNIPVLQKLREVEGERDMVDAVPERPRAAE